MVLLLLYGHTHASVAWGYSVHNVVVRGVRPGINTVTVIYKCLLHMCDDFTSSRAIRVDWWWHTRYNFELHVSPVH